MQLPIIIATIMRPNGETGVQTHFQAYAAWLSNSNHAVKIITPYNISKWKIYPIFALRRFISLINGIASVWWYRHWHQFFLKKALRDFLGDGKPCIVYAQCPLSANAALHVRTSPTQRVVMITHFNVSQANEWAEKGIISTNSSLFTSIQDFEFKTLSKVDGLVFVSEFMKNELINRIPKIKNIPSQVIPNFLARPAGGATPENSSIDLICIGTLEPRKNQCYALNILAAARKLGRPLTLTIVGDGPDRAKLERIVDQLGLQTDVKFAGYVKQAANLMPHHRACLHVSRMESFGIVLIEAMSRGLPVFAPAVGGIPEVFTGETEGRVIPLDDAETAAKLIIEWIDSPNIFAKASAAARAKFISDFEENVVAYKLLKFSSEILPHSTDHKR